MQSALVLPLIASALCVGMLQAQDGNPSEWTRDSSHSPMDDRWSYSLRLDAEPVESADAPSDDAPHTSLLSVHCDRKNRPMFAVSTTGVIDATYYSGQLRARVRSRLDQAEPTSHIWLVTKDYHTAFPYEGPIKKPENVASGSVLLVEIPIHRRGTDVLRFPLAGMESELAWLTPRCKSK